MHNEDLFAELMTSAERTFKPVPDIAGLPVSGLYVREWNALEAARYTEAASQAGKQEAAQALSTGESNVEYMKHMIAHSLVDKDGNPIIPVERKDDFRDHLPAAVFEALFEACYAVNGIGEQAVSDAEKNSDSEQSGGSPTS